MPFLAPLAEPLIMGGLGVGASLLGSKVGQVQPTPTENTALTNLADIQKTAGTTGQNLLTMGQNTVQQPINYWSSILSGNRGAITSAMAPELSRISQGYDQAKNTSAALNPRGGPSASFLSQLPFQQQRDVTSLFEQARPAAASSLATAGGGLLSQGANTLSAATSAGRDILSEEQNIRQQSAQNSRSIGQGLFDLIQKYGPGIIKNIPGIGGSGGGGGGSTGSGTATGGILGDYP